MAGKDNLIPMNRKTKEEQRKIARKGGIESGKTRRRKRDMKKLITDILNEEYTDKNGVKLSGLERMAYNIFKQAQDPKNKQAVQAFKTMMEYYNDEIERKKQKELAEIDRVKAETESIRAKTEMMNGGFNDAEIEDDGFLDALKGSAVEDWKDES